MSLSFELRLDQEHYKPGAKVTGAVVVIEGGRSRSLQVELGYVEETSDYLEVARRISTGNMHEGHLQDNAYFRFELSLPPDAMPNYTSTHGQLYWRLDVKSDEPGLDSHERRRIDVTN